MNWWYQSACQRRTARSGTTSRATARSKIVSIALIVPGFHCPVVAAASWMVYAQVALGRHRTP